MRSFQLTIILLLTAAFPARSEYTPLPLYYMALAADTVMDAVIVKVDHKHFYVRSLEKSGRHRRIKVFKFKNWPCARRWDDYQAGQHVLLLLKKEKRAYRIMSAGGEGEIPVIRDSVTIDFRSLPIEKSWIVRGAALHWDSIQHNYRRIGNKFICGRNFSFEDLKFAVYRFRQHFRALSPSNAASSLTAWPQPEGKKESGGAMLFALLRQDFYERKVSWP